MEGVVPDTAASASAITEHRRELHEVDLIDRQERPVPPELDAVGYGDHGRLVR